MEWYWTHKVIERLMEFVWIHPAWTIFIIYGIFHHTCITRRG